jgi:hypothetical protein
VFYADSRCNRLMRKKHIFQAAAALASLLAQLLQVPCAISRPPAMTRIRSAIRSATSRMCVVMITTGKWMFAARVVPRHVIFSYTAAGQPWADMESFRRSSCFGSTIGSAGAVITLTFVLLYALLARERAQLWRSEPAR